MLSPSFTLRLRWLLLLLLVVLGVLSSAATASADDYQDTVNADDPVAYWPMNDSSGTTATDISGNSHDATYHGSPALHQTGFRSGTYAANFDGSDDYASTPLTRISLGDLTSSSTHLTFETWIKPEATTNTYDALEVMYLGNFSVSNPNWHMMSIEAHPGGSGGGNIFANSYDNVSRTVPATIGYNGNTWSHVVATLDGSQYHLYVDGDLVNSVTRPYPQVASSQILYLARTASEDYTGAHFKGSMQDVAVYDRALTATEVADHYETGTTVAGPPSNTSVPQIHGAAKTGVQMTATPGVWEGTQPITYGYQWQRCDSSGNNCTNISGETSGTYTLQTADVGATMRVHVQATNSEDTTTASSGVSGIVSSVSAYQTLILNDNPVAYWPLDDSSGTTATDISGNSNDAAYHGSPSLHQPGFRSGTYAANFDGSDDYVSTSLTRSSLGNLTSSTTQLTFETWLDPDTDSVPYDSTAVMYLGNFDVASPGYHWFGIEGHPGGSQGGNMTVKEYDGTDTIVDGNVNYSGNTWSHVVATLDGSQYHLYINGELVGSHARISPAINPSQILYLARAASTGLTGLHYKGNMQNVAVYNRALTATEVAEHYETGTEIAGPPTNIVLPGVTGAPKVDDELTASTGSWTGTNPKTFTYQWRRCDDSGSSCVNITGATHAIYELRRSDEGHRIRVTVKATNSLGYETATSSPTSSAYLTGTTPGALDATFGLDGIRKFDDHGFMFGSSTAGIVMEQAVNAVTVQGDGKIVVSINQTGTGYSYNDVFRINKDGSRDTATFNMNHWWEGYININIQPHGLFHVGSNGFIADMVSGVQLYGPTSSSTVGPLWSTLLGAVSGEGQHRALPPTDDNKLVIMSRNSSNHLVVRRHHVDDGSLDTTFGNSGTKTLSSISIAQTFGGVVEPKRHRILLWFKDGDDNHQKVVRLSTNGDIDTDFGDDGFVDLTVNSDNESYGGDYDWKVQQIGVNRDYQLLAGGVIDTGSYASIRVRRWTSNGNEDSHYGDGGNGDGYFINEGSSHASSYPLDFQVTDDGSVVASGIANGITSGTAYYGMLQLDPDGNPDSGFGTNGSGHVNLMPGEGFGYDDDYGTRIALTPDSKYVLAGTSRYHYSGVFYANLARVFGSSTSQSFGPHNRSMYGRPTNGSPNSAGDPVNTVTGNVYSQMQDLELPGRGLNAQIVRSYNSQDVQDGPFGVGWSELYNTQLVTQDDGSVLLQEALTGHRVYTPTNADGDYSNVGAAKGELHKNTNGSFTLTRPNKAVWEFNSIGKLTSIQDANNNELSFDYDEDGLLETVTDPLGQTLTFAYDSHDHVTSISDEHDRDVTYTYNDDHQLETVTSPMGHVTRYEYTTSSPSGLLKTISTPGSSTKPGNDTHFVYDSSQRAASTWSDYTQDDETSDPVNKLTFAYIPQEQKTIVTDQDDNDSVYRYDAQGNVTSLKNPFGQTQRYAYDTSGNQTSIENTNGDVSNMSYDDTGNLLSVTGPKPTSALSRPSSTFAYDTDNNLVQATDPLGHETVYTYDSHNNLLTRTARGASGSSDDRTITFTYNSHGQLLTSTDPRGKTTTNTYGTSGTGNGRLITVTNPLSKTNTFTYNSIGLVVSSTNARGFTTDYTYDDADRLVETELPAPHSGVSRPTTSTTYDERDDVVASTDARGKTSTASYNPYHQLLQTTDPLGHHTSYEYNTYGNVVAQENGVGNRSETVYDQMQRPVQQIVADGSAQQPTASLTYNTVGQVATATDPNGNTTSYEYDHAGHVTRVTQGSGSVQTHTDYTYNLNGHLLTTTNGRGKTSSTEYDAFGEPVSSTDPLSRTTATTYNKDGSPATTTDGRGRETSYTYNDAGQLTQTSLDNDGEIDVTYNDNGAVSSIANDQTTVAYTRDNWDRPVVEQATVGSTTRDATHIAYNNNSAVVSVAMGAHDPTGYTYDDAGRLTTVTDPDNRETSYTYDNANRLLTNSLANGGGSSYTYNDRGQLDTLQNTGAPTGSPPTPTILRSDTFQYDANGNLNQITDKDDNAHSFAYDTLNRLTEETHPGQGSGHDETRTLSYTYDKNGNRLSKENKVVQGSSTLSDTTTDYTYDNADQMTVVNESGSTAPTNTNLLTGDRTLTYDDNGNPLTETNTTTDHVVHYTYDDLDQLIQLVQDPDSSSAAGFEEQYQYDPSGNRVTETHTPDGASTPTATTDLTWGNGQQQENIVGTSSPTTKQLLVYGGTGLLEQADVNSGTSPSLGNPTFFQQDQLGSVTSTLDHAGAVQNTYQYSSFGEQLQQTGSVQNPFTYLGNRANPATKLNDFHARSYSPPDGRFLAEDPIPGTLTNPITQNPYVYGGNNPFMNPDPMGTSWAGDLAGDITDSVVDEFDQRLMDASTVSQAILNVNAAGCQLSGLCMGVEYYLSKDCPNGGDLLTSIGLSVVGIGSLMIAPETGGESIIAARGLARGGEELAVRSAAKKATVEFTPEAEAWAAAHPGGNGEMSIIDWSGYPKGAARPNPVRILTKDEIKEAERLKNNANKRFHRQMLPEHKGMDYHEVHPVKFGGSPDDPANKIVLTKEQHGGFTAFWDRHQKYFLKHMGY